MRLQERPLRCYQREGLLYLLREPHGAVFWDMRLGKTLLVIRRIKMMSRLQTRRILVVSPYSAMPGWEAELLQEGQGVPTRLVGTRKQRLQLLRLPGNWFLTNWEAYRVVPEIAAMNWDAVVCDESTYLKNPQSQVSRFFTENFREAAHRYALTGTPAPESDLDYYQQLRFLDHGILGYQNFYAFRAALFSQGSTFNSHEWHLTVKGRAFLEGKLAQHASFLKRRDLKLGAIKVYQKRLVPFDTATRQIYRRVEVEFLLAYKETEKETIWATQKHIWLRRLCGGILPKTEGGADVLWLGKAQELVRLATGELRLEPLIIWCHFVEEIKFLVPYLEKMTGKRTVFVYGDVTPAKREHARRAFQNGEAQYFVGQPQCFRFGTDLSRADVMVFYSSPEAAETRQQIEDRFIKVEKSGSVLIIDLAVEDSVEEDLLMSQVLKEGRAEAVRRAVRRMQRKTHAG